MLNYKKPRCICIPNGKWWDADHNEVTESTQEYIKECVRKATMEGGELTNLLALKKLGYKDVYHARAMMMDEVPFKLKICRSGMACCGICTRRCDYRCVQDVIHKLYMKAACIYTGALAFEDADIASREAYKALTNPNTNYETLVDIVNSIYVKAGGKLSEENRCNRDLSHDDLDRYMYEYAPIALARPNAAGAMLRERNPETGEVLLLEWPETGLCPFCIPRTTYIRKPSGGRRRSD